MGFPRAPQGVPRGAKGVPRGAQGGPKASPGAPKEAKKDPPKPSQKGSPKKTTLKIELTPKIGRPRGQKC